MKINRKILVACGIVVALIITALIWLGVLNAQLQETYLQNKSYSVFDRNGKIVFVQKNAKNNYAEYLEKVPENFKNALLQKEDKYFYWHFGFNFWGIFTRVHGSSTITQQLAKILLENENQRNISNKFQESFYALALEIFNSKEKILQMYANSVYFGNQMQGLKSASFGYYNLDPQNLTKEQINQLLDTINSPTIFNPGIVSNFYQKNTPEMELTDYTTVDIELSRKIREIVLKNIKILETKKAKNSAVVVLHLPDNQILCEIGSPDPSSNQDGYQINMAQKPRQIGSTIKPFIYLLGFEKGMRPYTSIDDREYKYPTSDGYYIYPKNFDYKYRGLITANYALSNSINTAAVRTLDFVGLENFTNFLTKELGYTPPQKIDQYQIGIALGALEMDLENLAKYFSIFPNEGKLNGKQIADKAYVELINKILSDRKTAQDQFGAKSDLNLPITNYALKTGTSHDFKDSWVVGYTPDFLVAVWVGNADNSSTDGVSGQIGAGKIWNQVMQLMINSQYNHNSQFDFKDIIEYKNKSNNVEYGLIGDDFDTAQNILQKQDKDLILDPHDGDIFSFNANSKMQFQAKESATWKIKNPGSTVWQTLGTGISVEFSPNKEGQYQISASSDNYSQIITIYFTTVK